MTTNYLDHLFAHPTGLLHVLLSLLALITGTAVLIMRKGTQAHKRWGYVYFIAMFGLNFTALMIYNLFGGWGIFHYAAVISLTSIALGMVPVLRRKSKGWYYRHFSFMYWSVMGLYAALASELLTRIPDKPFFEMVGIATGAIMLVGGIVFGMNKKKWTGALSAKAAQ